MLDAATLGLVASGVVVGAVSAVTPFLPVEAYVLSVGATHSLAVGLAAAFTAALGQTCGKLVIFSSARGVGKSRWLGRLRSRGAAAAERTRDVVAAGGSGWDDAVVECPASPTLTHPPTHQARPGRLRRWWQAVHTSARRLNAGALTLLSSPKGPLVVLLSAVVGVPPLLAVSFYAGASTTSRRTFAVMCLLGRTIRFAALAALPQVFQGLV